MMNWLEERFAPGTPFLWFCAAFLLTIPLVWIRALSGSGQPTLRYSMTDFVAGLRGRVGPRFPWVIPFLRSLAVMALVVALARPQTGGHYVDSSKGIAIQMVLDISGSMAEQDFVSGGRPVRRLDAVKGVFESFVLGEGSLDGRENDLIGMTTLAMFAETRCPLTLDHGTLRDILRETDIPGWNRGRQVRETEEAGFTALGDGMTLATDDLRRAGIQAAAGVPGAEPAKSRVMILLTDGADNPPPSIRGSAPNPLEVARIAARLGIKIYTIGAVGDERVARSPFGAFFSRRAEVDEPLLKNIASTTGGRYFRATNVESLRTIYDEIDRLEKVRTGERSFQDHTQAARVAMLIGLALLTTEVLSVNTRFRRIP